VLCGTCVMWHLRSRREIHSVYVGKPEGKIPRGSPRCRWEVHVKMILKEWNGRAWPAWNWLWTGTSDRLL
jgi:hypothetical protein